MEHSDGPEPTSHRQSALHAPDRPPKKLAASAATIPLFYSAPLMAGDAGTAQTIAKIRELIDSAWRDPEIVAYASNVIRNAGVQPFDQKGQIQALYRDAKSFYFLPDPWTKEALHPAQDLIQWRQGDCDDINAILLPSVLGAVGFHTRLVTVAADARDPNSFSHIYCEVNLNGQWIPLDAARPGAQFGVAPPKFYKRWWWSIEDGSHFDYPGTGKMISAGMGRHHGMGDLTAAQDSTLINSSAGLASSILQAINGQPVVSALGPATGPGGYTLAPAPAYAPAPVAASTNLTPLLLLGGAALFAWALMK